jgi:hypothetical protein
MSVNRIRYTHKCSVRTFRTSFYNGLVDTTIPIVSTHPNEDFKIGVEMSGHGNMIISGTMQGGPVTETLIFHAASMQFTENIWSTITSIRCECFDSNTNVNIIAADSAYQPISWYDVSGPYPCIFSTLGGMSASIQARDLGLSTNIIRYMRVPHTFPVSKSMEIINVKPGFENGVYVPITDFNLVCIPTKYIPSQLEFNVTLKNEIS